MRVIRPQQAIVLRQAFQIGNQASLGMAVGIGWYLGKPLQFAHEPALWAALAAAPISHRVLDSVEPKPHAEWLLAGHVANGKDAREASVEVAGRRKRLLACPAGDGLAVPLDHPMAFGGEGHADNPLGQGHDDGQARLLLAGADGKFQSSPLAATTPLPPTFAARARYLPGPEAFDDNYLEQIYPGLPEGTDLAYGQMSAPDQWAVGEHWAPATPYRLTGLQGGDFQGVTPAITVQLAAWLRDQAEPQIFAAPCRTLWFFPDQALAVGLFHARIPLAHMTDLPVRTLLASVAWANAPRQPDQLAAIVARRDADPTGLAHLLDDELMPDGAWLDTVASTKDHPKSQRYEPGPKAAEHAREHYAALREAIGATGEIPALSTPVGSAASLMDRALLSQGTWPSQQRIRDTVFANQDLHADLLAGRHFENVSFRDCRLGGVSASTFTQCRFERCRWEDADLHDVVWQDCHFQDTQLKSLRLHRLIWRGGIGQRLKLDECSMHSSELGDFYLEESHWYGCRLRQTRLHDLMTKGGGFERGQWLGAFVDACVFDGQSWLRLALRDCSIERSSFIDARWSGMRLESGRLTCLTFTPDTFLGQTVFEGVELDRIGWRGVQLPSSRFERCSLTDICIIEASLRDSWLSNCDAPGLMAAGADLSEVRLETCSLVHASLQGSLLAGARFIACDLGGADLAGCGRLPLEQCLIEGARLHPSGPWKETRP
jgi:uncharacterized protein YjbI with pentapeptide repeats